MASENQPTTANDVRMMVADADLSVREVVRSCVKGEGWNCDEAKDGIGALKLLRRKKYHLVVLEAELPEINGELVCMQIRKTERTPVIFLSKRSSENERLAGFYAGGNDYLIKPFFPRELTARIKSLLGLYGVSPDLRKILHAGSLRIDLDSHNVMIDERPVQLTPREYDLLLFLCQNQGKAFSRDSLLDLVWGEHFLGTDRTVDTHIKSLRNKIRPHNYIVTIWGYGYKFEL